LKSDFNREYPVDMVREAYIHSDQGIKGFSRRYGLSEALVKELATLDKWDEARDKYKERMYRTFSKKRLEVVEWRQDLITEMERFELIALESVMEDMADHFTKYGDLFLRDEQEEVRRDSFGNPIIEKYGKKTFSIDAKRDDNKETISNLRKSFIEKIKAL